MKYSALFVLGYLLCTSCGENPEACIDAPTQIQLGEKGRIFNCSRNYDDINVRVAGFLNESIDLPQYQIQFDRPGTFEIELTTRLSNKEAQVNETIEVRAPSEDEILGNWRLYKEEGIGEFAFNEQNSVYNYEVFEIFARDENLNFTDNKLTVRANQNVDRFFAKDDLTWQLQGLNPLARNRLEINIDGDSYFIVAFHQNRMILYYEREGEFFQTERRLVYLEKRD